MKKEKVYKIIKHSGVFVTTLISVFLLSACSNNNKSDQESTFQENNSSSQTDKEVDNNLATEDVQNNTFSSMYFDKITYLDKDEQFLLTTNSNEQISVDLEGNATYLDEINLTSLYLDIDYSEYHTKEIYHAVDIYGNNVDDKYIVDSEKEKIIGMSSLDEQDIIWVLESVESPTESLYALKAYDESGIEILELTSKQYQEQYNITEDNAIKIFSNIDSVYDAGANICKFCKYNEGFSLAINTKTKEFVDSKGIYYDGYSIIPSGNSIAEIIDSDGNSVSVPYGLSLYAAANDGLIYSNNDKCFYNINLEKVIDLSEYNLNPNLYFLDGYSLIKLNNPSGNVFSGIIDTNGDWVYELEELNMYYERKISDNVLLVRILENQESTYYSYNINSKELNKLNSYDVIYNNMLDYIVEGKAYYLSNGYLYCYDFINNITGKVELK